MTRETSDHTKVKTVRAVAVIGVMAGFVITLLSLILAFSTLKPALTTIEETQESILENAVRADNPKLVDAKVVAATFPPILLTLSFVGTAFILSGIFIMQMGSMKALWKMYWKQSNQNT